ncbi:MAG: hypothetical protein BYD32DRAFT_92997 [Podila humilis]|nr:MAG: hypothetical protein BYD32DRAFT_92997 [Podila humilis]
MLSEFDFDDPQCVHSGMLHKYVLGGPLVRTLCEVCVCVCFCAERMRMVWMGASRGRERKKGRMRGWRATRRRRRRIVFVFFFCLVWVGGLLCLLHLLLLLLFLLLTFARCALCFAVGLGQGNINKKMEWLKRQSRQTDGWIVSIPFLWLGRVSVASKWEGVF